jgi:hypothetical protein
MAARQPAWPMKTYPNAVSLSAMVFRDAGCASLSPALSSPPPESCVARMNHADRTAARDAGHVHLTLLRLQARKHDHGQAQLVKSSNSHRHPYCGIVHSIRRIPMATPEERTNCRYCRDR